MRSLEFIIVLTNEKMHYLNIISCPVILTPFQPIKKERKNTKNLSCPVKIRLFVSKFSRKTLACPVMLTKKRRKNSWPVQLKLSSYTGGCINKNFLKIHKKVCNIRDSNLRQSRGRRVHKL